MDKFEALKQYFGYDRFKSGQEAVIDRLSAGQDVVCVMPTGAGKSLCYQIPALVLSGLCLVISPLISLMRDQVQALCACGVPAAYINSSLDLPDFRRVLSELRQGVYKIVYCAPERLDSAEFRAALAGRTLSLIAVDEAHCVSQWGQDFRPSYLKIPDFIASLPFRPAVGAFTATATPRVRADIEKLLLLNAPYRLTTGFDRPNLYFGVMQPRDKDEAILALLRDRKGRSGIVYCQTRKTVEYLCDLLCIHGFAATRYHAGLSDAERTQNQTDFLYDRKTVMVATNAFGMGIDKSNVAYVLHYQIPMDLESYYQEAGRAGRDGENADCIVLFDRRDVRTCRYLIENSDDNPELDDKTRAALRELALKRLDAMVEYCQCTDCLRAHILRYFGEPAGAYCGNCTSCRGGFSQTDITLDAQKIISCVVRAGQKCSAQALAEALHGDRGREVRTLGLDRLSTFGILRDREISGIRELIDELIVQKILRLTQDEPPLTALAPRAAAVIREGERVTMRKPKFASPEAREAVYRSRRIDDPLFDALRSLRAKLAIRASVQPTMIFTDATLREMCERRPKTPEEFLDLSGVNAYKCRRYAGPFLEVIASFDRTAAPRGSVKRASEKAWSEEEDTLLRHEAGQGLQLTQIVRSHGRTRKQILERMRALGITEE